VGQARGESGGLSEDLQGISLGAPPRLLELHEIQGLLDELPQHLIALVSVVVHAGLRSAETYRLQWHDIDWEAGELTVASRRGGHTKSYKSRRIPMGAQLVEDLRRHPRSLKESLCVLQ
jgi:integrase